MLTANLAFAIGAFLAFSQTSAYALPANVSRAVVPPLEPIPPLSIIDMTVDYFQNQLPKSPPSMDQCLFYTEFLSQTAKNHAKNKGLITIWGIWDCQWYNGDTEDIKNPLRDIFKSPGDMRQYFAAMSKAMANICTGKATLMTNKAKDEIPQDGIWYTVEFPALKDNPNVPLISAIGTDGEPKYQVWPDLAKRDEIEISDAQPPQLQKRSEARCTKYSSQQLSDWFDNGNVDW